MKKSKNNSRKKNIKISGLKIKLPEKKQPEEKPEEKEESGLEEQIQESEIIVNEEFHHFLPSEKAPPPVLQRVESRETNLEQDIADSPLPKVSEENTMSYSSSSNYFSTNYGAQNRNYEEPSPVLERTRTSGNMTRAELLDWRTTQSQMRDNSIPTGNQRLPREILETHHDDLPSERKERKYTRK